MPVISGQLAGNDGGLVASAVVNDLKQIRARLAVKCGHGRKGMTLMLLWQDHAEQHPGQAIHSYSQFCENYRRFAKKLKRSMRQVHRAGEILFIDYAGPTVALTDGSRAHIFVSALVSQATPSPMPRRMKPWLIG